MSLNPETIARDNPDIEHLVSEHLGDYVNGDGSHESSNGGGPGPTQHVTGDRREVVLPFGQHSGYR